MDSNEMGKDAGLAGNNRIEDAIAELAGAPSPEELAHTLTVIRRRMKENGQVIVAVMAPDGSAKVLSPRILVSEDGRRWWTAFTSFDEQMLNKSELMSTFLVDMNQLFHAALTADGVNGIILNPWNMAMRLDRRLIEIILGINT